MPTLEPGAPSWQGFVTPVLPVGELRGDYDQSLEGEALVGTRYPFSAFHSSNLSPQGEHVAGTKDLPGDPQ